MNTVTTIINSEQNTKIYYLAQAIRSCDSQLEAIESFGVGQNGAKNLIATAENNNHGDVVIFCPRLDEPLRYCAVMLHNGKYISAIIHSIYREYPKDIIDRWLFEAIHDPNSPRIGLIIIEDWVSTQVTDELGAES